MSSLKRIQINRQIYQSDNWTIYNLSFCDLIRTILVYQLETFDIYKNVLNDENAITVFSSMFFCRFNQTVPIYYVNSNLNLKWDYGSIATCISLAEFYYYDYIRNKILLYNLKDLSRNPVIPISFIRKYRELNWSYVLISRYNQTFQESDLDDPSLIHKLDMCGLSGNSVILLPWIITRIKESHIENAESQAGRFKWDWIEISCRLTWKEIQMLNQDPVYRNKLNWHYISTINPNITAEIILSNDCPWVYNNFQHPTIEYYRKYPNQYIYSSDRISLSDLIQAEIPIPMSRDTNFWYLSLNKNLTIQEVYQYRESFGTMNIYFNDYSQPKIKSYYKCLYSQIIKEITY